AESLSIPEWRVVALYEFFYGLDFISTELIFRGFLILGMHKYLGPYVVYPMVVSYCVLHFGKPLTEAISSIFGGYILGIIALYHRNIWGGVIIHVGVAWGMEIIGYLHRVL
ncbi:MAG TPA: CPBP family intramembrane glutamic endopeptidase, partial [Cryomorphaceae bacterium]|nr:CPBP family intramembrane glutamic endopeptidase [Cryomorphaceae bacterium]